MIPGLSNAFIENDSESENASNTLHWAHSANSLTYEPFLHASSERSPVVAEGGEQRWRLRKELNFVNGAFLCASHSTLKAKPPGWGLWSAGIRHAQSVPLLKSPSKSYLFEQPSLNLFLYQLVGCDLAKCFGNRRHRWMVKWRRFLSFCFLLPRWFPHMLVLPISPVPSPSV